MLGSSPAAAAARAAASPAAKKQAADELAAVALRYGGLFPEAAPIAVVERLWVAAALARSGLFTACLATMRSWAQQIYDPAGVRGAPGLMPDADDTAMAILVAALTGRPRDPGPLAVFGGKTHYHCYLGEDTRSVTANAHALQALDAFLRLKPAAGDGHGPRMNLTRDWLLAQQRSDGFWMDKWHASPYYATQRCVYALADQNDTRCHDAVRSAAAWVLETQHDDGSWGVWDGTAEETAYAVTILLRSPALSRQPQGTRALERAEEVLRATPRTASFRHPGLWHDKTLYAPQAVVRAEVLAAVQSLQIRTGAANHSRTAHSRKGQRT
ncbi:hypothetical protein ACWEQC_39665 [Streptomyces shenzhenensis]